MILVRLFIIINLLFLGISVLHSQDSIYKLSEDRNDEIQATVDAYVKSKENITDPDVQKALLKELAAKMPLKPEKPLIRMDFTEMSVDAQKQAVNQMGITADALRAKLKKETETMFPVYKKGDKVTIAVTRGTFSSTVSGTLYRISATNVLIGNTTVAFIDMDLATRGRFDEQANEALKEKYVQDNMKDYFTKVTKIQQGILDDKRKNMIRDNQANGYLYIAQQSQWRTAESIVNDLIAKESEIYLKRKRKEDRIAAKLAKAKAEAEAKEKAENDAREKAAQAQAAARAQQSAAPAEIAETPFSGTNTTMDTTPQDILSGANVTPAGGDDSGIEFTAMSPEELTAAMNKIEVDEKTYTELMKKVQKRMQEINSTYFGIDADQGFKKALWGFSEREVHYALSKEREAVFKKKLAINRNDIIYPPGSRPVKIILHYHLNALYKVDIFMGDLTQREFNIYKNSLHTKYGMSDTQRAASMDLFQHISSGDLTPDKVPVILKPLEQEGTKDGKSEEEEEEGDSSPRNFDENGADPLKYPYVFVWEGSLSQGILSFFHDPEKNMYLDVVFEKIYLPSRLEKEKKAKAEAAKVAAEGEKAVPEAKGK